MKVFQSSAHLASLTAAIVPSANPAEIDAARRARSAVPATQASRPTDLTTVDSEALINQLQAAERQQKFLSPEAERRYLGLGTGLSIPGFEKPKVELFFLPGNTATLRASFSPAPGAPPLSPEEFDKMFQDILLPQLSGIDKLSEEGHLSRTILGKAQRPDGSFILTVDSRAGIKSLRFRNGEFNEGGLSSPMERAVLLERAAGAALREALAPQGNTPEEEALRSKEKITLVARLAALRDLYEMGGAPLLARTAQALIVRLDPTVDGLRRYADLGRLTGAEISRFPKMFQDIVSSIEPYTKNIPPPAYFQEIAERTRNVRLPSFITALLQLELAAEVRSPRVIEAAELEMREAVRFARDEYRKTSNPSLESAAEIAHRYFSKHFPNEYVFTDGTPGLAAGIACRRTDCSTRALMAKAMLDEMGFETGIQIISATQEGRPIPGSISHVFNYIEQGGKRTYLDFTLPESAPYIFRSNDPIIHHYRNGSSLPVELDFESSEAGKIVGRLYNEPIIDDLNIFAEAFGRHSGNLSEFLFDRPDFLPRVSKIVNFFRCADRLYGTKQAEPWEIGTREALSDLLPELKAKGSSATAPAE